MNKKEEALKKLQALFKKEIQYVRRNDSNRKQNENDETVQDSDTFTAMPNTHNVYRKPKQNNKT